MKHKKGDSFLRNIKNIYEYAIGLIYPPSCVFCREVLETEFGRKEDSWVCSECAKTLPLIDNSESRKSFSVAEYQGTIQHALHKLKYGNRPHITKTLARITFNNLNRPELFKADCITPVPIHRKKLKNRGYNQAALYAQALSGLYGLNFIDNILIRIKDTPPQSGLNTEERRKNIEGAFETSVEYADFIKGKTVLLIDDINTTGSTLDECCKTLLNSGAKEIFCLTFASTLKSNYDDVY